MYGAIAATATDEICMRVIDQIEPTSPNRYMAVIHLLMVRTSRTAPLRREPFP
jgi:hypothetical protein